MTTSTSADETSPLPRPRRLVVLLGLVSIGALAALAVMAVHLSSTAARNQARRQVASAAAASSVAIRQELSGMADVVASVASRPHLIAALGSGDVGALRVHTAALQQSRPEIRVAFITDPRGTLIDIVPPTPSIVGQDFSFRDWYRGVTETGRAYVSEVYRTAATGGGLVVGVAAQVHATSDPASPVIGILVAGYEVESIQRFVNEFATAQGVTLRVADQRGVQVASPGAVQPDLVSWQDDPEVTAALAGASGTVERARDGTDHIAAYVPVEQLGWALIAELPTADALSGWTGIRNGIVGATFALGLAVLAALFLLDRTLRRRVAAEGRLRQSQSFLDSIIENIPTTIYVKDADELRFVTINRAGEELLGRPRAEMIGRSAFDVLPPDEAAHDAAQDRVVLERREALDLPGEQVRSADGTLRILHTRKIPVNGPDGQPEYLLGISNDVTEQRQASDALDAARRAADAANFAKSEFLSRMSHELRTPLNAVLGFGQLLQLDELSGDQTHSVDHIMSAGHHLLALIDEVLDLARIETGELRLSLEPVWVRDVVDQAVGMMRPLAGARSIDVTVDVGPCGEDHVRADRQRLKQVLVNLLANAVKYNREGGRITIELQATADDLVRITVADTGIGIAEHDLTRLFVAFERLGAADSTIEGTGLGLTLTKQLVEAMGGEIGVASSVGIGSTFWVELPRAAAPIEAIAGRPEVVLPAAPTTSAATTILYIEDNLTNVRLLERIVASRPRATLLVAMQGQLGLDLAREHRPTMILLDLHLPDMGGQEVLHRLRADERTASIPIFVLSADATPGQVQRLLAAGATDYLTKPFDVPRLLALVDSYGSPLPDPMPSAAATTTTTMLDRTVTEALHDLAALSAEGGDQVRQLVELYIDDARSRLAALDHALHEADSGRVAAIAHSLAGSSANLGADELADRCRELEREARRGVVTPEQAAPIATAFAAARAALHTEFLSIEEATRR